MSRDGDDLPTQQFTEDGGADFADDTTAAELDDAQVDRLIQADERLARGAFGELDEHDVAEDESVPRCLRLMDELRQIEVGDDSAPRLPSFIGRFPVERLLGVGGFGLVYLGVDPDLRRPVALKVPRTSSLYDEGLRKRFLRESRTTSTLDHPHVLPVYEVGFDGDTAFIAMAYCEGGTLQGLLADVQMLDPQLAAKVCQSVADAIHHAHELGIIHRDLKPANLFIRRSLRNLDTGALELDRLPHEIQVADFGLAAFEGDSLLETLTQGILGTPTYMSPEQAKGQGNIDARSDVYAIGAILYRLLCGRAPYIADDSVAVLQMIVAEDPSPPRFLRREVDRNLEAICLKCLSKHPEQRYASSRDLADDLERFLAGEPVKATPYRRIDSLVSWTRRNPKLAVTTAFSMVLAAVLVVGSMFAASTFRRQRDELRGQLQENERVTSELEQALAAVREEMNQSLADKIMKQFRVINENGQATARDYQERGEHALNFGEYELALADFERMVEIAPDYLYGHVYLAWVLSCGPDAMVDPPRALASINRGIPLATRLHWSHQHVLGYALYVNQRYDEALERFEFCIENVPRNHGGHSMIWAYKAMCEQQLGMTDRARQSLEHAEKAIHKHQHNTAFYQLNLARARRLVNVP